MDDISLLILAIFAFSRTKRKSARTKNANCLFMRAYPTEQTQGNHRG